MIAKIIEISIINSGNIIAVYISILEENKMANIDTKETAIIEVTIEMALNWV